MVGFLIFANWAKPEGTIGLWAFIYSIKWYLSVGFLVLIGIMLTRWFKKGEVTNWVTASWTFAKQIMPLLLAGVIVAGLLIFFLARKRAY